MILLTAILAGWLVGWIVARWRRRAWLFPAIRHAWLALLAFAPQFFTSYLPVTRLRLPDEWAAASLVVSQSLLLLFCWLNRRTPGIPILAIGLAMNLSVIAANGGFMPISPEVARRLVPAETISALDLGSRFGWKDVLLLPEDTRLAFLSDRLLLPDWSPYQVAFSAGDVMVALGAFWLMVSGANGIKKNKEL